MQDVHSVLAAVQRYQCTSCASFQIATSSEFRSATYHPQAQILLYYPSAACTALWLPVKFRICCKITVISFKAIHNLRPAYLSNLINIKRCSYLAITCEMWALFCMTLLLSFDLLLGTDHLLQLLQRYGSVYWTVLGKGMILISLRDSLRHIIFKRPIATCLELS